MSYKIKIYFEYSKSKSFERVVKLCTKFNNFYKTNGKYELLVGEEEYKKNFLLIAEIIRKFQSWNSSVLVFEGETINLKEHYPGYQLDEIKKCYKKSNINNCEKHCNQKWPFGCMLLGDKDNFLSMDIVQYSKEHEFEKFDVDENSHNVNILQLFTCKGNSITFDNKLAQSLLKKDISSLQIKYCPNYKNLDIEKMETITVNELFCNLNLEILSRDELFIDEYDDEDYSAIVLEKNTKLSRIKNLKKEFLDSRDKELKKELIELGKIENESLEWLIDSKIEKIYEDKNLKPLIMILQDWEFSEIRSIVEKSSGKILSPLKINTLNELKRFESELEKYLKTKSENLKSHLEFFEFRIKKQLLNEYNYNKIEEILESHIKLSGVQGFIKDAYEHSKIRNSNLIQEKIDYVESMLGMLSEIIILHKDIAGAIKFTKKYNKIIDYDDFESMFIFKLLTNENSVTKEDCISFLLGPKRHYYKAKTRGNHIKYDELDLLYFRKQPLKANTICEFELMLKAFDSVNKNKKNFRKKIKTLKKNILDGSNNLTARLRYVEDWFSDENVFLTNFTISGLNILECMFTEELREAKNIRREAIGLPRIGEGWIGELHLLKKVKEWFPLHRVVHQWSPEWLGRQRIDIGFPDNGLAIEYHGTQHFEPVDFFGGEDSFKNQQERDFRKGELCKKNKVKLLIFTEKDKDSDIKIKIKKYLKG